MSTQGELVLASRWDGVFDAGAWVAAGLRVAFSGLPEWAKYTISGLVGLALLGGWAHSLRRRRRASARPEPSESDEPAVR